MDTLRESDPSVIRLVPDRDPINHHNSRLSREESSSTNPARGYAAFSDQPAAGIGPIPRPLIDSPAKEKYITSDSGAGFPSRDCPYAIVKRSFDVALSAIALAVLFIPMMIVALLIKLTDRGPIIFKQVRVGKGGRHFVCYKFRSMCVDAEQKKEMLMHLNEASGPVFKIKRDPRITWIGRFIRKASIDELPQLINVLRGDMSIVGPRPPIPSEVATYTDHQRGRLAVQPGLTCLWQVSGRSNVTFERWVELDLAYIDTMSFFNDIKIVLMTIPAVLRGSGAH